MNKFILLIIIPLLSLALIGCNDENDEIKPMDLRPFAGAWEVVDQGNQVLLERGCIVDITSSQIFEGYGGYQGYFTTYSISDDGVATHDRVFTWSIREVENHRPLLDVVYQGELDSDDPWAGNYQYKIIKLTDSEMSWQVNTIGDHSVIKFIRRNDIQIE